MLKMSNNLINEFIRTIESFQKKMLNEDVSASEKLRLKNEVFNYILTAQVPMERKVAELEVFNFLVETAVKVKILNLKNIPLPNLKKKLAKELLIDIDLARLPKEIKENLKVEILTTINL